MTAIAKYQPYTKHFIVNSHDIVRLLGVGIIAHHVKPLVSYITTLVSYITVSI